MRLPVIKTGMVPRDPGGWRQSLGRAGRFRQSGSISPESSSVFVVCFNIYLAVLGLSCGMQNLRFLLWNLQS